MSIVKCKFSKFKNWDDAYMQTQKEYTFKCDNPLSVGDVLYGAKYKKYLHITNVTEQRNVNYFSPEKLTYSNEKEDDSFMKIAEIVVTIDRFNDTNIVVTV
jgi:hypothetical protein